MIASPERKTTGVRCGAANARVSPHPSLLHEKHAISAGVAASAHTGRLPRTLRPACSHLVSETTRSSAQPIRITEAGAREVIARTWDALYEPHLSSWASRNLRDATLTPLALGSLLAHGFDALQGEFQPFAAELGVHDDLLDVSEEVRVPDLFP